VSHTDTEEHRPSEAGTTHGYTKGLTLGAILKLRQTEEILQSKSRKKTLSKWVYHSVTAGDDPLSPPAESGSGLESHPSPAGQNLGQKAETSGLSSLHAPFQSWGGGQGALSVLSMEEKIGVMWLYEDDLPTRSESELT
jgi:hypothetical protein